MSDDHLLAGLRAARIRVNITPQVLAESIGVDVRSYYRYELGQRRIYLDKAWVLADTLGVSLDELRKAPIDPGTVAQAERRLVAAALDDWSVDQ